MYIELLKSGIILTCHSNGITNSKHSMIQKCLKSFSEFENDILLGVKVNNQKMYIFNEKNIHPNASGYKRKLLSSKQL